MGSNDLLRSEFRYRRTKQGHGVASSRKRYDENPFPAVPGKEIVHGFSDGVRMLVRHGYLGGSSRAKRSLLAAMKGRTSSSGAVLLAMRFPHFTHSWTMTYPRFFRTSRSTALIIAPQSEARSQGNSASTCNEVRQCGQWFLADHSGCASTSFPQLAHRKDSFFITKGMGFAVGLRVRIALERGAVFSYSFNDSAS